MIHREFLLTDGPAITIDHGLIPPEDRRKNILDRRQNLFLDHRFNEAKQRIIESFEKEYLTCLIKASNGNVTLAAKRAGKERRTLGKLLKKYNIPGRLYSGDPERGSYHHKCRNIHCGISRPNHQGTDQ